MKYSKNGSLKKNLPVIIKFKWISKLFKLKSIISGLDKIHQQKLIHCDFHHGNILSPYSSNILSISDLGLCFFIYFIDEVIHFKHTVKNIIS